jgi:hypothetical protein
MYKLETELTHKEQTKLIRISQRNYDILCELGKKNDTFNDVMNKIFEKNGIVKEED